MTKQTRHPCRLMAGIGALVAIASLYFATPGCDRGVDHVPQPARSAVVVISGDTGGWIVPCGCTANQSGGLLRRATYLRELRRTADVLYVDAGGASAGTSPYFRDKFRAVVKGERLMDAAVHNLGGPELAMGPDELRAAGIAFVSANVRTRSGETFTEPSRVITVGGVRIAIVGVVSPKFSTSEIAIDEPAKSVTAAAAKLKGTFDSLIVLAYVSDDELTQLAAALPEADAVIGGPTGQAMSPRKVGPVLVASATNKGKFLIALDVPPKADAGAASAPWSGRVVELGTKFGDDDDQKQNLQLLLNNLAERDYAAVDTGLVKPIEGAPANYRVAGSQSCIACHAADSVTYSTSKHAHANDSLVARGGFQADPSCLQCHTTGFGLPGGFSSPKTTAALVGVGCESCHGPSAGHVAQPAVRTPFNAMDQCIRCHDHENSPSFDRDVYWSRIKHGVKGAAIPKGTRP